jgi:phosphate transport system protein
MSKHFLRDLDGLKKQILIVGSMVEIAIHKATTALLDRRAELAAEVIHGDDQVDRKEVQVEEEVLKVLALNQPVAADLRFAIAVLKVNNDLERMGDLAVNIAERATFLAGQPPLAVPAQFQVMVQKVRSMVNNSLDALVNLDLRLARKVLDDDDLIDSINRDMWTELISVMKRDPDTIERATQWLSCSRHLERIADQTTNIAEDVLFMVEGEIMRHRGRRRVL